MDNPHIRLLFYAFAVSGACVEVFGSVEVGVCHPSLYWAAVAGIIPCGLLGILQISQVYVDPACECQARDVAQKTDSHAAFAMAPATLSDDLRFGAPLRPRPADRRRLTLPLMARDGVTRARRESVVERC